MINAADRFAAGARAEATAAGFTNQRAAFDQAEPYGKMSSGEDSIFKSFGSGMGAAWIMALGGDRKLTKPYAQNPWVYSCVRKIADSVASLPMRVQKPRIVDGKTKWENVETGQLASLIKAPNPLHSQRKFLELVTMYHLLHGESYWILQTSEGEPVSSEKQFGAQIDTPTRMWPVAGPNVSEKCGNAVSNLPTEYRVHAGSGKHTDYPAAAVAPVAASNPYSHLRGLGPMTAAMREAGKMFQADRYDEALLRNGGRPGGFLTTDQDLGEEEGRAVLSSFRQAHDSPDKHGKTALLPYGTTFKEAGFKPKDMEFNELREYTRQTIMSVFGVTKSILGITDDVNRANAAESTRTFWEVTVLPIIRFLQDEIQHKLISRLKGEESTYRVVLDTSGVSILREDLDAKVERVLKLHSEGKLSLADAATAGEWPELAQSDFDGITDRWVPANLLPSDAALDPGTSRGSDGVADPGKAFKADEDELAPVVEPEEIITAEDSGLDAEREAYSAGIFKAIEEDKRKAEKKLKKKVQRVMEEYVLAVRAKLRKKAKKDDGTGRVLRYVASDAEIERLLDMNMEAWADEMAAAAFPEIESTLLSAAAKLSAEVGGEGAVITITDPAVVEFMASKEVLLAEGSMTNLAKSVQSKIVKVLAGAEEATSVGSAIAEVLEELVGEMDIMINSVGARAERIAVTEVGSATSRGRTLQMVKDGIEKHEWGTQGDGTVRDSHASLRGMVREVGKEFGYGLHEPHDGAHGAGPEQIVNCHCFTMPVL